MPLQWTPRAGYHHNPTPGGLTSDPMPGGRPRGRGRHLDEVVGRDHNQQPITVFDRIVSHIGNGSYFEEACAAAGVSKVAAYEWEREGARLAREVLNGRRRAASLTKRERRLVSFVNAVDEAQAAWAVDALEQLDRIGRGGQLVEVVTVKTMKAKGTDDEADGPEELVETTTRSSWREPNPAVIMWRLERRFPDKWGRHRIEVTGADGGPIEVSPREIVMGRLGLMEARLTGRPVGAIEASSTEVHQDPDNFDD